MKTYLVVVWSNLELSSKFNKIFDCQSLMNDYNFELYVQIQCSWWSITLSAVCKYVIFLVMSYLDIGFNDKEMMINVEWTVKQAYKWINES